MAFPFLLNATKKKTVIKYAKPVFEIEKLSNLIRKIEKEIDRDETMGTKKAIELYCFYIRFWNNLVGLKETAYHNKWNNFLKAIEKLEDERLTEINQNKKRFSKKKLKELLTELFSLEDYKKHNVLRTVLESNNYPEVKDLYQIMTEYNLISGDSWR